MRNRWLTLAALALVAVGAFSPAAAFATDPLTLDEGYVTDDVGALTADEESKVEARLQELSDNSTADLYVVLVDDFTSPTDNAQWADLVADWAKRPALKDHAAALIDRFGALASDAR